MTSLKGCLIMTKGQYKQEKDKGLNPDIDIYRAYYYKNLFSPNIRDHCLCEFLGLTQIEYNAIVCEETK